MIVEALVNVSQPVFVYIPPFSELRGGAWVVVDPSINPNMMEMYAAENSRGGVLEAEGIVSVKFREKYIRETMMRLDAKYRDLVAAVDAATDDATKSEAKVVAEKRYNLLAPMYHQVAVAFADLHDTPGRMKAKGCISEVIQWREARRFFTMRLKRRVYEEALKRLIIKSCPQTTAIEATFMLRRLFFEANGNTQSYLWDDNKKVADWYASEVSLDGEVNDGGVIASHISELRQHHTIELVQKLGGHGSDVTFEAISSLVDKLTPSQRSELASLLTQPN